MNLKSQLYEAVKQVYHEQQAFTASLGETEQNSIGKIDRWSIKDNLVHIAFWEQRLADNMAAHRRGEQPTRTLEVDKANAEIYTNHQMDTWQEVMHQADQAQQDMLSELEHLTLEDLLGTHTLPWQTSPLWRTIAGTGALHPIIHLASCAIEQGRASAALAMYDEVMPILQPLSDDNVWRGMLLYDRACVLALAGMKSQALSLLQDSLALDPSMVDWAMQDSDLASLHDEPEFQALSRQANK